MSQIYQGEVVDEDGEMGQLVHVVYKTGALLQKTMFH